MEAFVRTVERVAQASRREVHATGSGFLAIDLAKLRGPLVALQEHYVTIDMPYPDPAGVILSRNSGDYVLEGEVLATVRCSDADWPIILNQVGSAFTAHASPGPKVGFEEVYDA